MGNILEWDVSKVKDMNGMFENSKYNKNLSKWHLSNEVNICFIIVNYLILKNQNNWNIGSLQRSIFYI